MRVLIAVALLMVLCGMHDYYHYHVLVNGPPKPLPFDLPAREITEHVADDHCKPVGKNSFLVQCTPVYVVTAVTCKYVASDWQQRVLLDSADGKHHCYAFYLLEQKP